MSPIWWAILAFYLFGWVRTGMACTRAMVRDVCGDDRPDTEALAVSTLYGCIVGLIWPPIVIWVFAIEPALRAWLSTEKTDANH